MRGQLAYGLLLHRPKLNRIRDLSALSHPTRMPEHLLTVTGRMPAGWASNRRSLPRRSSSGSPRMSAPSSDIRSRREHVLVVLAGAELVETPPRRTGWIAVLPGQCLENALFDGADRP